MNNKLIFCKMVEDAIIPKMSDPKASGYDICSCEDRFLDAGKTAIIHTGIKAIPPEGYEIQVRPRSGLAVKNGITVLNTPGTVDENYRGEICVILHNTSDKILEIEKGMRIAQLVLMKVFRPEVVEVTLEEYDVLGAGSERGENGFGSTGLKSTK